MTSLKKHKKNIKSYTKKRVWPLTCFKVLWKFPLWIAYTTVWVGKKREIKWLDWMTVKRLFSREVSVYIMESVIPNSAENPTGKKSHRNILCSLFLLPFVRQEKKENTWSNLFAPRSKFLYYSIAKLYIRCGSIQGKSLPITHSARLLPILEQAGKKTLLPHIGTDSQHE